MLPLLTCKFAGVSKAAGGGLRARQYPKSQSHTVAEVGKNRWRSSCPTPLLKQGYREPVAQDRVQKVFEYQKV